MRRLPSPDEPLKRTSMSFSGYSKLFGSNKPIPRRISRDITALQRSSLATFSTSLGGVELARKLPNSKKLRLSQSKNALGERLACKNRTKSR